MRICAIIGIMKGPLKNTGILPVGCARDATIAEVLEHLAVRVRPMLMKMDETQLVNRIVDAVSHARSVVFQDLDMLARDAGMHPKTLMAGVESAFDRIVPNAVGNIPKAVDNAYHGFGARTWTGRSHLFAVIGGRLPDPTLTVVVTALAVRTPVLLKPPREHGAFAAALVRAIQQADPVLGAAVGVIDAPGDSDVVRSWLGAAESVVVFGGDETIRKISMLRGARHFVAFGHKEAVEVVDGDITPDLFADIARDVCMYDQAGCLSPHVVAVRRGLMEPAVFAKKLYRAILEQGRYLPPGEMGLEDRARIRLMTQEITGLDAKLADPSGFVPNVAWQIPGTLRPGPGNRFVQLAEYDDMADLAAVLEPLADHVQAVAVHPTPEALEDFIKLHPRFAGAWITRPGTLQSPPLLWPEDGRLLALALTIPLKFGV